MHKSIHASQGIITGLQQLHKIIIKRLEIHFHKEDFNLDKYLWITFGESLFNPDLKSFFPELQKPEEWIVLMLGLVPHVQPNFFEPIIAEQLPEGGNFVEFGGVKGTNHRGMLATGETAQFIVAGTDIHRRLTVQQLFAEDHFFTKMGVLYLEKVKEGEPQMSGRIIITSDWVEKLLFGKESNPKFGSDFPAKKVTTAMDWQDVVLHPRTMQQVTDISTWLKYNNKILQDKNLGRKIKPGYRVLFFGSPGTGKTLTAALLGKQFKKDVYRIDLSQIVSKYIGETEKNLEQVFKLAETKDWILFFDEADALFGKRTNVQSAHDKYANQEVSYLLQRVEDYPGLMILASNIRNNVDDAFIRRFNAVVHFPMPNANERLALWNKSMPESLSCDSAVNLDELAKLYELSGASILNAVQFATLQSFRRNDGKLYHTDLIDGIRKEFMKEEKSF